MSGARPNEARSLLGDNKNARPTVGQQLTMHSRWLIFLGILLLVAGLVAIAALIWSGTNHGETNDLQSELHRRTRKLENELDALKNTVVVLTVGLNTVQTTLTGTQHNVTILQQNVTTLQEQIANLTASECSLCQSVFVNYTVFNEYGTEVSDNFTQIDDVLVVLDNDVFVLNETVIVINETIVVLEETIANITEIVNDLVDFMNATSIVNYGEAGYELRAGNSSDFWLMFTSLTGVTPSSSGVPDETDYKNHGLDVISDAGGQMQFLTDGTETDILAFCPNEDGIYMVGISVTGLYVKTEVTFTFSATPTPGDLVFPFGSAELAFAIVQVDPSDPQGHNYPYDPSYPLASIAAATLESPEFVTIATLGTNDIHEIFQTVTLVGSMELVLTNLTSVPSPACYKLVSFVRTAFADRFVTDFGVLGGTDVEVKFGFNTSPDQFIDFGARPTNTTFNVKRVA